MSCPLEFHDFDPDGKCTHCDTLTGEAFWKTSAPGGHVTTAEAAQRWAEAKEKLGAAVAALDQANTAHDAAAKEEHEAWEALERLAGRVPVIAATDVLGTQQILPEGWKPMHYKFDDGFIK